MRVVIITSSSNRSGGTRQAMYQAEGLLQRGHDVTLCLPKHSSLWELPENNAHWIPLPEQETLWRDCVEALLPDPATPTIVHAFHNKAVKRVAWWGLRWMRRRLACVAHRGVIYRPGNPLPYLSPAMKAFLVNSHACAQAMRWHCPASKLRVVNNGVPDARVTPKESPQAMRARIGGNPDDLLLGYVGNNKPAKGLDELLQAVALANLPSVRLVVIGTDPERWIPRCEELGIAQRVHHVGRTEQVSDYLQLFDAFVFPSNTMDSAPNTLLEAIRMGLPVVATRVGGVPEIVNGNGILVTPQDIQGLARALQTMMCDSQQRSLWAAASQHLGRHYTVDARCTALEAIYQSVLPS